jgi:uridine kinase
MKSLRWLRKAAPSVPRVLASLSDEPVFVFGLLLRIAACLLLVPDLHETLFVPFLRETLLDPSLNPWARFLESGGSSIAFPYGPVMYLAHVPTVLAGILIDGWTGQRYFVQAGFSLSLLIADLALLLILRALFDTRRREVTWLYWLSPIVLYVTYYHGQTDIIPTTILVGGLWMLKRQQSKQAGILIGLAICAKISMLVAVPFVALYVWRKRQLVAHRIPFFMAMASTIALAQGVFLLSPAVREMLFSREIGRIYQMSISLGGGLSLHLLLVAYLLVLYFAYAMRTMNFDLLFGLLGVAFLIILTLAPAATGWMVWLVPFLVGYQMTGNSQERPRVVVLAFSVIFVIISFLTAIGPRVPLLGLDWVNPPALFSFITQRPDYLSILVTMQASAGFMIAISMYRRGVARNDFFRLSSRPISVGIAGDSGSGKDTLARALAGLFPPGAAVGLSGDDYHRYERNAPMWEILTHLDPRTNELKAFTGDSLALIAGEAITCRHYDHATGFFTPYRRVGSNDVVLITGLHALYSAQVREALDVSVFLDMQEDLRRCLKIRRDVTERGHSPERVVASIEKRNPDSQRYIQPQKKHADLVFQLTPINPESLQTVESGGTIPLKLVVRWRDSTEYPELARILIGLCGMRMERRITDLEGFTEFEVEGEEVPAEDLRFAAGRLAPEFDDVLASTPKWSPGILGIMQLLILVQLVQKTRRRK